MAIGEKIQQLRKMNNLSQEQLAEKLAVSRQSISKWELGESTPDTEKIILLSRIFQVSTDYLLHDDINSDMEIPAVKTNSELLKKQYGLKTLFIITTGIIIIGLLMSIVAQVTWQTIFSVSIGLIIQIIGVIVHITFPYDFFIRPIFQYLSAASPIWNRSAFYSNRICYPLWYYYLCLEKEIKV
jgi:transcriptional regulator with XRE-family HTH domain